MADRPEKPPKRLKDANTLGGRMRRYASTTASLGGFAAKTAVNRMLGREMDMAKAASELRAALGGLKGPVMKVAQLLATVPDLLPPEFAEELATLQSSAPPMGWPFVRRRMAAELGPDWPTRFTRFDQEACAAASLGQVHRAVTKDGIAVACKLQYPDMASAVEADLGQLDLAFAIFRRAEKAIDAEDMKGEIAARLREELDYALEARHIALYRQILADRPEISVPDVVAPLSTQRLLTMSWLEGRRLLDFKGDSLARRNTIAANMFTAWWLPFVRFGAIHGDPHLGNYTVRGDLGINLLDYGCIRTFRPGFVGGVVGLYRGLLSGDRAAQVAAYETWGFKQLSNDLIDTLNIWARFIYAPLLDDRVRTIADGVSPAQYGRKEAFEVHSRLKTLGPVKPPREFVFMDRAAIGLGAVFLHLGAELNFYRLFNDTMGDFDEAALAARQRKVFKAAGVSLPV
jgi:predicted unusual protein kinase regulating ubiquinone biosynthesis (AarF/ABC1/UbiB family)